MQKIFSLLNWMQGDGRRAALFLSLGATTVLVMALFYQSKGFLPCHLCYLERKPHIAIAILGLVGFFVKPAKYRMIILTLVIALALFNSGVSLYHVGVEQHWWSGPNTCTQDSDAPKTMEETLAQIYATPNAIPCDVAVWFLFGISMAGWNGIISFCMMLWAAVGFYRSRLSSK